MQAYNSSIIAENVSHYAFWIFLDIFYGTTKSAPNTKEIQRAYFSQRTGRGKKFPVGSSDQVGVPIGLPDLWGFAHGPWSRRWACSTVAPSAVRFMSGPPGMALAARCL